MSTPQTMDRQTFLANLRQSGLVNGKQLNKVAPHLPPSNQGSAIAQVMVDKGLLTKFQAELLLNGRSTGFHLGQYRILDYLGRGGMGRVFKAEHQTMNRVVAIKVLAPQMVKTPKVQQLFQREVRAAAQLVHPNIVTAFDANQAGDRCYLVMEYVDGPNMEDLVRQHGPLSIGMAAEFIRQVATGLQYAHEMGMVHRDIKPANLLVQRAAGNSPGANCQVKILDFGLARLQGCGATKGPGGESIVSEKNQVMGTPDYLSPEQARNLHNVDIRSDLYALGCTFYFLLTGKVPFPGGNTLEKLVRHSTDEAIPLEHIRKDVPRPLLALIRKLMAKDPKDRYQAPMEVALAVAPYAVQGPLPKLAGIGVSQATTNTPTGSGGWTPTGQPSNKDEECALGVLPARGSGLSTTGLPSVTFQLAFLKKERREQMKRWAIIGGAALAGLLLLIFILWLIFKR